MDLAYTDIDNEANPGDRFTMRQHFSKHIVSRQKVEFIFPTIVIIVTSTSVCEQT